MDRALRLASIFPSTGLPTDDFVVRPGTMKRLGPVIAELEAARAYATARFAAEANMPIEAFLRHFQVVLETGSKDISEISFRVEPRND